MHPQPVVLDHDSHACAFGICALVFVGSDWALDPAIGWSPPTLAKPFNDLSDRFSLGIAIGESHSPSRSGVAVTRSTSQPCFAVVP